MTTIIKKPTFDLTQLDDLSITNKDIKSPKLNQRNKPKSQFRKRLDEISHIRVLNNLEKSERNSIFKNRDEQKQHVSSWKPDHEAVERQT